MAVKASGAPGKQQRLLRLVECPVYLNELGDPRFLSCNHTLCHTCLKDYTVNNLPKFFLKNELKEVVMSRNLEVSSVLQKIVRKRLSIIVQKAVSSSVGSVLKNIMVTDALNHTKPLELAKVENLSKIGSPLTFHGIVKDISRWIYIV